jgi:hypothetical protein
MGVSINGGNPNEWLENTLKWMINRGTPSLGNPH